METELKQLHAKLAELFPGRMVFLKIEAMNYFMGEVEVFYTASVDFIDGAKIIAHRANGPSDLLAQANAYARTFNRTGKPQADTTLSAAS